MLKRKEIELRAILLSGLMSISVALLLSSCAVKTKPQLQRPQAPTKPRIEFIECSKFPKKCEEAYIALSEEDAKALATYILELERSR
jgi:hypothetical protein